MKTLKELAEQREKLLAQAEAINKGAEATERDLTEAEVTKIQELLAEVKTVDADIDKVEAAEKCKAELAAANAKGDELVERLTAPAAIETETSTVAAVETGTDPAAQTQVRTIREEKDPTLFGSFGGFLGAVQRFECGGGTDPRLRGDGGPQGAASGQNIAVPSEGGFLVQTDQSSELLRRVYETGAILSRTRNIPLGPNSNGMEIPYIDETSRVTGSRYGGVRGYWVAEAADITASKMKFGKIQLKLNKLATLGYATDEMLQDSTALDSILMDSFSEEITWMLEEAILWGTGAGQPQGAMTGPAVVSVPKVTSQTANTLWGDNVINLWTRMYGPSRANAVWLINQDVEPFLFKLTAEGVYGAGGSDSIGIPIYTPAGMDLRGNPVAASLFGRPVLISEHATTVGDVGDIMLADFSQYLTIAKGQMKQAMSMHVRFVQDEMAFKITYRFDGQSKWQSALTPAKGSATTSPFVYLAARD